MHQSTAGTMFSLTLKAYREWKIDTTGNEEPGPHHPCRWYASLLASTDWIPRVKSLCVESAPTRGVNLVCVRPSFNKRRDAFIHERSLARRAAPEPGSCPNRPGTCSTARPREDLVARAEARAGRQGCRERDESVATSTHAVVTASGRRDIGLQRRDRDARARVWHDKPSVRALEAIFQSTSDTRRVFARGQVPLFTKNRASPSVWHCPSSETTRL